MILRHIERWMLRHSHFKHGWRRRYCVIGLAMALFDIGETFSGRREPRFFYRNLGR